MDIYNIIFWVFFLFPLIFINISSHAHHSHHHHRKLTTTPSSSPTSRFRLRHQGREAHKDCTSVDTGGDHNNKRCGRSFQHLKEEENSSCPPVCHQEMEKKSNKPICGSDGQLYPTHCALKRWSCLTKSYIHPVNHSFCLLHHNNHHHHFTGLSSSSPIIQDTNLNPKMDLDLDGKYQNSREENTDEMMQMDEGYSDSGISTLTNLKRDEMTRCSPEEFDNLRSKLLQLSEKEVGTIFQIQTGLEIEMEKVPLEETNGESLQRENMWKELLGDGPEADKDNLIRLIFSSIDQNKDLLIDYTELYTLDVLRVPQRLELNCHCQFRDFLLYDDSNGDGKVYVSEFYSAFSHLYGVTMISLEKALEWKEVSVELGQNVILKCDITGYPPTSIIWFNQKHLNLSFSFDNEHMRLESDGSISLINVQLYHGANYSCRSPRNIEVIQTHSLHVFEIPRVEINPKVVMEYPNRNVSFECRLTSGSGGGSGSGGVDWSSYSWSWIHNGILMEESFNEDFICTNEMFKSQCTLLNAKSEQSGSFTCQIKKSIGIGESNLLAEDTATLGIIDDWREKYYPFNK